VSESTNSSVAAGWYPDPASGDRVRWWDGNAWTDRYQQAYTQDAAALKAPEGTKVYNPWIWLVVLLPYVTLPFLFLLDFSSMFDGIDTNDPNAAMRAQLEIFTSPAFIGLFVAGFVTSILVVVFGYLDWKALNAAGVPKPFHWAFVFLNLAGYPVYAIGRAVVTKRRTGHGSAVLWVTIGMIVLSIIVAIVWSIVLVTQVFDAMSVIPIRS
jgi:hypothetical protein